MAGSWLQATGECFAQESGWEVVQGGELGLNGGAGRVVATMASSVWMIWRARLGASLPCSVREAFHVGFAVNDVHGGCGVFHADIGARPVTLVGQAGIDQFEASLGLVARHQWRVVKGPGRRGDVVALKGRLAAGKLCACVAHHEKSRNDASRGGGGAVEKYQGKGEAIKGEG